ncbi:GPI mannosyltransferase 4 [Diabrotica virgifera virgifera]|uniref:Mannosyltransferase n=1 Tax=Diabrotica virgifera virgifera TaxID=50390 RepID=A0A6P7G8Y2_DIAVI|nr:GPI mannosyltransferase 4 [Diabrotica virgifera virgifera]
MKKKDKRNTLYIFQIIIRILLVLLPQTGYIHPDEYFQSVEVLAGKIFDVQCSPPWEFNVTTPIRSMTIPYFTIGIPYGIMRNFNALSKQYLNQALLTPYMLLIVPRILMCLCSFLVDYCLYKLCLNNNEKYKSRLIILASSYVMIVYGTRTFSNTVELVLFSLLLYFVCESLIFNNTLLRKKEYLNFRYDKSKTTVDKAKFHKLRLYLTSDSYRSCFIISTITVFGFFNRPTFLAFSVIPIFFWLYRGIGSKSVSPVTFYSRLLVFALCTVPSFLFNIFIDSLYYAYLTWGEIGMLTVSLNNFVFTPLNFLRYNTNLKNLAIHGLHPRFLHALVNIPLLFNVLGVCGVFAVGQYLYLCCLKKFNLLPTVRSIKCLMTLSFIVPLAMLSIFPHQEPRFLIPLIVPLVYLHATTVLPETDYNLVEAPKVPSVVPVKKKTQSYVLLRVWLLLNTILTLLYGFLHQGGVFSATNYLSQQMKIVSSSTEYHIVTSHIYSLPESFFLQRSQYQLYLRGQVDRTMKKRVFLYEEGSKDLSLILKKIKLIINLGKKDEHKTYLLISGSLEDDLEYASLKTDLKLHLLKRFSPHLSFEAFPNFSMYCLDFVKPMYRGNCIPLPLDQYFNWLSSLFALNLYRVESSNNFTSLHSDNE